MNLCLNGHDRDAVGVTANRECRACKHTRRAAERTKNRVARLTRAAQSAPAVDPATLDGLEDEYGPRPPAESDYNWFDAVAVDNAVFGGLRRPLTRLERAEFIRRTARWEASEVAMCGRMTAAEVQTMRTYQLGKAAA